MDPVIGGLIAMGVGGGLKSIAGLFDNSAAQRATLMRQQASMELSSLEENMRRVEGQQTQVLSSTKARMAATGFSSASTSFDNYLSGMSDQFKFQNQYAQTKGVANYDMQMHAADLTGDVDLSKWLNFGAGLTGMAGNIFATGKFG